MNVKNFILIFSVSLFFISSAPYIYASTNNLDVINLQVYPKTIKVGNNFSINATVVNNYNDSISIHNGCGGPFTVVFDSHAKVEVKKVCNFMAIQIILKPGANTTLTSLNSNLDYRAQSVGLGNANVTISYSLANQTGSNLVFNGQTLNVSKSLSFAISKAPSPLEQFRSGIATKDVICGSGFQLVSKAENNYPYCVTPSAAIKLKSLGWALE